MESCRDRRLLAVPRDRQIGGGILPLADFGTVHLSDSVVDGSPIGDLSPVEIYMTDSQGRTRDTVSALSSEENFSATWVSAN